MQALQYPPFAPPRATLPPVPLRRGRARWRIAAIFLAVLAVGSTSLLAVRHGSLPTPSADDPAPPRLVGIGYVDVEGGPVRLAPAQAGRVVEVHVHEGDTVKAGAVLLQLDNRSAQFAVEQAEAALQAAEAHAARARELAQQHPRQVAARRATAEAAGRRLAAAEHVLTQKQELRRSALVGDAEVAIAREQVNELRAAARAAHEQQAEAELANPALRTREADADVASCRARLGQARHTLDQCKLRAPEAGSVLRVSARRGEALAGPGGETAILFCPDGPRLVRVEIEQEFISRVKVGLPAEIEDEADPEIRWSGRVAAVGGSFNQRRSIRQQPTQLEDVPVVECRIALDPGYPLLRIGQRVQVTIGAPASTSRAGSEGNHGKDSRTEGSPARTARSAWQRSGG